MGTDGSRCWFLFPRREQAMSAAAEALGAVGLGVEERGSVTVRCGEISMGLTAVPRDALPSVVHGTFLISGHSCSWGYCDQVLEVELDDRSAVLDEINTLIEVQGALQGALGAFVY